MMAKTSVVQARVNTELKENVEIILENIGLTIPIVIKLLFEQIEINNGLPFEIKVPEKIMAEKKLIAELTKGEQSVSKNGWIDPNKIREEFLNGR